MLVHSHSTPADTLSLRSWEYHCSFFSTPVMAVAFFCGRPHFKGKQNCEHFSDSDTGKRPLTMIKQRHLQHWKYNSALWVYLLLAFIGQVAKIWFTFSGDTTTTY